MEGEGRGRSPMERMSGKSIEVSKSEGGILEADRMAGSGLRRDKSMLEGWSLQYPASVHE